VSQNLIEKELIAIRKKHTLSLQHLCTCKRKSVTATFWPSDKYTIPYLVGWNTSRPGKPLCDDENCAKQSKCNNTIHAEHKIIQDAAKHGIILSGGILTVSLSPCYDCVCDIIATGIRRVEWLEEYRITDHLHLLEEYGIECQMI